MGAKILDRDGLLSLLRAACEAAGSQQAFADKHDITKQYLSDVLSGRRAPGEPVLLALNAERVERYRVR